MASFTTTPTSLADVENLITGMYDRRTPRELIPQIQDTLQGVQKSKDGWQLASNLLDRPYATEMDKHFKFFGALTIIVKLNTDSSSLSEEDALMVLHHLLGWVASELQPGSVVASKLCHALSVFFIHFPHIFAQCIRRVICSIRAGRAVNVEEMSSEINTHMILENLSPDHLRLVLSFLDDLVNEVGRTDANSRDHADTHKRLLENLEDVNYVFTMCLSPEGIQKLAGEGNPVFETLGAWIKYAQGHANNSDNIVTMLRTVALMAIECLPRDLTDSVIDLCSDTLSNYASFFDERHYGLFEQVFQSPWAQKRFDELFHEDPDEASVKFGQLMLAFGDAKIEELLKSTNPSSQKFLENLCSLLNCAGYIVETDEIFVPALEFWSSFIETMCQAEYDDPDPAAPWKAQARLFIPRVVLHCWTKIQYPPAQEFSSWDSDFRIGFNEARKDVADLLQSLTTISGIELIAHFVELLLQSIKMSGWADIEASSFCLASISDFASESNTAEVDKLLEQVFSSTLFSVLNFGQADIPARMWQTSITLIDRYADYFERHPEFISEALNLLFGAVSVTQADQSASNFGSISVKALEAAASKAILTLCASCRLVLADKVETFLEQFRVLHAKVDLDPLVEERVLTAITSIVQSINPESRRLQVFDNLLSVVQQDADESHEFLAPGVPMTGSAVMKVAQQLTTHGVQLSDSASEVERTLACEGMAEFALRLLVSMAKGMQELTDSYDLDPDSQELQRPVSEELAAVHWRIWTMMYKARSDFPDSHRIIEAICDIFKAGFSETQSGPFVFQPDLVTQFLLLSTLPTPKIGSLVSTACGFLSSLQNHPKEKRVEAASRLLPWVVGLLRSMPSPDHDTELAQDGIEFASRVMNKYPAVMMQMLPNEDLEFLFLFILQVLEGKESLPKGAAADFWTSFLILKSEDPSLLATIHAAEAHLGPHLALSLMRNIGGNAARSELDKLSEPLRKLVAQKPQASAWLEAALMDASFPSTIVSEKEKREFLAKIVRLRGARQQTNHIVREFWLKCRGSSFAFAS